MDDKTLNNLKLAYQASPSSDLAKVIVFGYIDNGNTEGIEAYISSLSANLSQNELEVLASIETNTEVESALIQFAENISKDDCLIVINKLLEIDRQPIAKNLYLQYAQTKKEIRSVAMDKRLDVEEKPQLKVVEKTDFNEVTDISNFREKTTNFADVIGLENIKKQIHKKIILPFQSPSLFQRFKKKAGGGVLLYGPPGCGKTLLARATAGECNASFFNIEVSDVLDMYIGESEQKLHAIFEKARNETPCVLFFDEIEALAGKREHARNNSFANIVSQFLTELDGFSQKNNGVLVLASTNTPWTIDPAFLRPGRFDRLFFVTPPDKEARLGILNYNLKERPVSDDIDLTMIAKKTSGYSGADLANIIEIAADEAIDASIDAGHDVAINYEHLKEALTQSRDTTSEWLTTARNYARYANDGGRYNDVLDFINKHGKR